MPSRRSYQRACGTARALYLVGERWSLLVVRELLLGPKRFTDFRQGLPQISPDVLAQRLRDQGAAGLVRRRDLAPPAASLVVKFLAARKIDRRPAPEYLSVEVDVGSPSTTALNRGAFGRLDRGGVGVPSTLDPPARARRRPRSSPIAREASA